MSETLLRTKLFVPPLRPNLVRRRRLVRQLNQGLQLGHKLSLISAPAGFGKTTLVSVWVGRLQQNDGQESVIENRIAWLSLDERDNDPTRFLAYFIGALNQIEGIGSTIGRTALGMLQSPQSPLTEGILISLINDIAALPDRIILVIDDYHIIDSSAVHDALSFILEQLPPPMHLVIATRVDPQLPLARLRARGQLTELRAVDLRFTSSEAAEFLNQMMGLNLSTTDINGLESRTEGWIAGLQLAAVALQGLTKQGTNSKQAQKDVAGLIQSFTGSHRFILDYLLEEVLDQQSESVQLFLLQTAVLDRMTGPLCDAVCFGIGENPGSSEGNSVTNRDKGQIILERLEHANLFIVPLDEERQWYRYHHLFSELLQRRLRQEQPDLIPSLHGRASRWYEQNGFGDEGIEHALRAEEFEWAAQQIEKVAEAVWMRGEDTKLRRWLNGLPAALVLSKPQLGIYHAWDLLGRGQLEAADRLLQAAELALEASPEGSLGTESTKWHQNHNHLMLPGRIAVTRAFSAFYRGDIPGIIEHARLALQFLPEQDLSWRSIAIHLLGDAYDFNGEMTKAYHARLEGVEASKASGNNLQIMITYLKLAINLRHQGRLSQVSEICRQQLERANESGLARTAVAGWLLGIWGEVLAEMNDLDGGRQQAKKGVELTEHGGDLAMRGWSYLCLIRVLYSVGDIAGAAEIITKIEDTARKNFVPPWIMNLIAAWQARIWLAQGKFQAASQWIGERDLDANREPKYLHEMEYIVLARILFAQRKFEKANHLLEKQLISAAAGGRTSRLIEIFILQALVFQGQGDITRAIDTLGQALTLAEPGGFIRIFVDEGPPMAPLLSEAAARGIVPDYVLQLLAAFPLAAPQSTSPAKTPIVKSELIEPLSDREIEVIQLIAEGLTNSEIASRLYLSLNTVKVHTRNISSKLDTHNRTQAVARARALGILPPT